MERHTTRIILSFPQTFSKWHCYLPWCQRKPVTDTPSYPSFPVYCGLLNSSQTNSLLMPSAVTHVTCCLSVHLSNKNEIWGGKWSLQDNWTIPQMTLNAGSFVWLEQYFSLIVSDRTEVISPKQCYSIQKRKGNNERWKAKHVLSRQFWQECKLMKLRTLLNPRY